MGCAVELVETKKQQQETLKILGGKGAKNKADYFTKHHPPNHHLKNTDTTTYSRGSKKTPWKKKTEKSFKNDYLSTFRVRVL